MRLKKRFCSREYLHGEVANSEYEVRPAASLFSAHMQFETATHQVIEWLPVRISLGPGFDWLHEAKWVENDEQAQRPALSWVGPSPCL